MSARIEAPKLDDDCLAGVFNNLALPPDYDPSSKYFFENIFNVPEDGVLKEFISKLPPKDELDSLKELIGGSIPNSSIVSAPQEQTTSALPEEKPAVSPAIPVKQEQTTSALPEEKPAVSPAIPVKPEGVRTWMRNTVAKIGGFFGRMIRQKEEEKQTPQQQLQQKVSELLIPVFSVLRDKNYAQQRVSRLTLGEAISYLNGFYGRNAGDILRLLSVVDRSVDDDMHLGQIPDKAITGHVLRILSEQEPRKFSQEEAKRIVLAITRADFPVRESVIPSNSFDSDKIQKIINEDAREILEKKGIKYGMNDDGSMFVTKSANSVSTTREIPVCTPDTVSTEIVVSETGTTLRDIAATHYPFVTRWVIENLMRVNNNITDPDAPLDPDTTIRLPQIFTPEALTIGDHPVKK
ncbi:hypothetical protein IPN35_01870 [Candidatus Peregrinibacteria bacterium]|nr:MAG: hypothetical protein IPN35_01870 [Candidatus Peregrinibacteria bacterium]